jgi:hypothetical protein
LVGVRSFEISGYVELLCMCDPRLTYESGIYIIPSHDSQAPVARKGNSGRDVHRQKPIEMKYDVEISTECLRTSPDVSL